MTTRVRRSKIRTGKVRDLSPRCSFTCNSVVVSVVAVLVVAFASLEQSVCQSVSSELGELQRKRTTPKTKCKEIREKRAETVYGEDWRQTWRKVSRHAPFPAGMVE